MQTLHEDRPDLTGLFQQYRPLVEQIQAYNNKLFWDFGRSEYGPAFPSDYHHSQIEGIAQYVVLNLANPQDPWSVFAADNQGIVLSNMVRIGLIQGKPNPELPAGQLPPTSWDLPGADRLFRGPKRELYYGPTEKLFQRILVYLKKNPSFGITV